MNIQTLLYSPGAYKIWFALFFTGMGLVIPQIGLFVPGSLQIPDPGKIYLFGQVAMPIGAFIAGYISDKTMHIRYIALSWTIMAGISLVCLSYLPWGVFMEPSGIKLGAAIFWSSFMFFMGGIIPLINISYLQNGHSVELFGRVRLYGTLGFAIPNGILSFAPNLGSGEAIRWAGIFMIASVIFLFLIPRGREGGEQVARITLKKTWALLSTPLFIFFLFITMMFYFSFSTAEYVISPFIFKKVQNLGLVDIIRPQYFVWFLGTLVEIGFFFISPFLIRRFGPLFLIAAGLVAGCLRYLLSAYFENDLASVFTQGLHGIQFAGCYLGALLYLQQKTNPRRLATSQALYTTFGRAIGTGGGSFFLGNLAAVGAYALAFHISALVSFFGLILLFFFSRYEKRFSHFTKD
ncbi:MAG: MFS transporter [Leptospirales bacterium]